MSASITESGSAFHNDIVDGKKRISIHIGVSEGLVVSSLAVMLF